MEEPNLTQNQPPIPEPRVRWFLRRIKFSIWFPVVVAIAFAAGYLSWQKTLSPGPYDLEPVNIVRNNNSNLPRDEVLRGWQTYRNEEFGFGVRYPNSWTLEQKSKIDNGVSVRYIKIYRGDGLIGLTVIPNIGFNEFTVDNIFTDKNTILISYEDMLVGGVNALKYITTGPDDPGASTVSFIKEGHLYTFDYNSRFQSISEAKETEEIFNQILSTFRFIE